VLVVDFEGVNHAPNTEVIFAGVLFKSLQRLMNQLSAERCRVRRLTIFSVQAFANEVIDRDLPFS
jgi:hypothetical protein